MNCSNCGKTLDENVQFCPNCEIEVAKIKSETSEKLNTDATKTNVSDIVKKVTNKVEGVRFNLLNTIITIAVFIFNTYVIVHNFCVHDGYLWAILGVLVNISIFLCGPKMVKDLFPKLNSKIGYAIFGVIFFIGAIIVFKPFETYIEESSVPIVSELLVKIYGARAAECTGVTILKETEKYTYKGKAHLNNGNTLDIWIEYYDKTKYIEVSLE